LSYLRASFQAMTASRSFREYVTPCSPAATRAYCCVMVEAPCVSPPVMLFHAARTTPPKSMPSLVQNVWSSAATIDCFTASFISSYASRVRFSEPSLAIWVCPSA
jgi:hypothetical protein